MCLYFGVWFTFCELKILVAFLKLRTDDIYLVWLVFCLFFFLLFLAKEQTDGKNINLG